MASHAAQSQGRPAPGARCTLLTGDGGGAAIEAMQDVQPRAAVASYPDGDALISPAVLDGIRIEIPPQVLRGSAPATSPTRAAKHNNNGTSTAATSSSCTILRRKSADVCGLHRRAPVSRATRPTSSKAAEEAVDRVVPLIESRRWRLVSKTFPHFRASLQDERFKRAHCPPSLDCLKARRQVARTANYQSKTTVMILYHLSFVLSINCRSLPSM